MPGKTVQSRLKNDVIIWFATCGRDGHPHVVPVWFWWDGESFLIYSVPGQKVRDVGANPNVALHLNSDQEGGDVVRVDGAATIVRNHPPAYKVPGYLRKYREHIKDNDWTPKEFSDQYHVSIRVRKPRFH
ncbi:MAG: TIGR03667 family PPOX class F420-dependent oxidoreductase [Candidatus Dormibacteraeota bacterium]|nr:TIGR03667 family PPOX class F420-dependent oxidoreductase [Candidatus Dormibacteraeota bacterium]